jgi:hypothetical protein
VSRIVAVGIAAWIALGARPSPRIPAEALGAADRGRTDAFGTSAIYPGAEGGREWHARWDAHPRVLGSGQIDPEDAEFRMEGRAQTLEIRGDGTARSAGEQIRIYVGDRTRVRQWKNVELTIYAKRVADGAGAGSTSGFEFQVRTDDGHTSSMARSPRTGLPAQCDGHAYGFAFRNDGRALVEKEIRHPTYTSQAGTNVWGGGTFPKDRWIGMKVVVYNVDGGRHVKQELWRDLTDGQDGGTWVKVFEHTDAGGWSIDPAIAASCGVPADHLITDGAPFVILRGDRVAEQWYKKFTIREIRP